MYRKLVQIRISGKGGKTCYLGSAWLAVRPWHRLGFRPRLCGLAMVSATDRLRGVLCDSPAPRRPLSGSRITASPEKSPNPLIAMLLLKYLQLRARCGWSLSNLAALLRQQLFCLPRFASLAGRTVLDSASLGRLVHHGQLMLSLSTTV